MFLVIAKNPPHEVLVISMELNIICYLLLGCYYYNTILLLAGCIIIYILLYYYCLVLPYKYTFVSILIFCRYYPINKYRRS